MIPLSIVTPFAFGIEDAEEEGMPPIIVIHVTEPDGDKVMFPLENHLLADEDYLNEKELLYAEYLIKFNCAWPEDVFDQIRNFSITKDEQDIVIQTLQNAQDKCIRDQTIAITPIPVDPVKLHADYVDSIISLQKKPAPLEQIYRGIRAPAVICNNDFVVVLKWTSYRSACVSPQTAEKLVERNWGLPAKNLSMNFSTDPYEIYTGTIAHIYFDYDGECKYYDTKLIKKLRENILEQHKELGWPREHIWENMWITNPGDQCRFVVDGFLSEDTLRRTLETIEGISNFRDYQRPYN